MISTKSQSSSRLTNLSSPASPPVHYFAWRSLGLKIALQKEKPRDSNMINVYTFTEHMTRKWQENIFEEEENQIIVANCGKLSTAINKSAITATPKLPCSEGTRLFPQLD